jgi:hypothetical protein
MLKLVDVKPVQSARVLGSFEPASAISRLLFSFLRRLLA